MENKATFSTENLTELQSFMCDTMCSDDMAVDWFCDRFGVDATDEVVDFVLDAHDAFFGNWILLYHEHEHLQRNSQSLEHRNSRRLRDLQWTLLRNVRWGWWHSLHYTIHHFFLFPLQLITNMSDTKFLIHGRNNRTQMNQCLAYLYPTAEEAVAQCLKNHPDFVINEVTIDDSKPEVVKLQSLI